MYLAHRLDYLIDFFFLGKGGKHHRFKRGYKNVIDEAIRLVSVVYVDFLQYSLLCWLLVEVFTNTWFDGEKLYSISPAFIVKLYSHTHLYLLKHKLQVSIQCQLNMNN